MIIQTSKNEDYQNNIALHTHYYRMTIVKKTITSVGKNVEKLGTSHMLAQMLNAVVTVENSVAAPQKVKHSVPT